MFEQVCASSDKGLTSTQVKQRQEAGAVNVLPGGLTSSVGKILLRNIFTLFNFINLALAVLLIAVGEPKNALFAIVAVINTIVSVFQELRAKRTLDTLSILGKGSATVVREGARITISPDEIVPDDIVCLSLGDQIYADATVLESESLDVDESQLSGESSAVHKQAGDKLLSGSFVTAGSATSRVTAVGADSYASALTIEAKEMKAKKSQLMRVLTGIIRVLTFVIVPLGALLYLVKVLAGATKASALLGTAAAMTGMIPQGLVLLTGLTLMVGAVSLSRRKALVQSLYSIETLARSDVLCLDKTGTITDGTLKFEELICLDGTSAEVASSALARLCATLQDANTTALALRKAFPFDGEGAPATMKAPFSSARKWSGASFAECGSIVMGAPDFVFPDTAAPISADVDRLVAEGYRVLCLATSAQGLTEGEQMQLPEGLRGLALVVLSDTIRKDAPDTFRYLKEQGMAIKVLSGDDPRAVSAIARRAGLEGADLALDMSQLAGDADLSRAVEDYTVYGRVSPHQKRNMVRALQQDGHVVCMTGDGVNDVLAMKEADCGVAMLGGSSAARSVCDFVLMSENFSAMVNILNEGRRVINNIESVSALYLVKTIYSVLLTLIFIFLPLAYPFEPIQMTAVTALVIGIPTFLLAFRPDKRKPEGRFVDGLLKRSLPAALAVVLAVLAVQVTQARSALSAAQASTICAFLIGAIGFAVLFVVARPLNRLITLMLGLLVVAFLALFFVGGRIATLFSLTGLLSINAWTWAPLLCASLATFWALKLIVDVIIDRNVSKVAQGD
ncbi:MAG: HAD-IC family P-type ATPase [Coriobacteriia bacterium]|nr:HAD-IC family P-type ATPase [Coriobacteriia bacterium]